MIEVKDIKEIGKWIKEHTQQARPFETWKKSINDYLLNFARNSPTVKLDSTLSDQYKLDFGIQYQSYDHQVFLTIIELTDENEARNINYAVCFFMRGDYIEDWVSVDPSTLVKAQG